MCVSSSTCAHHLLIPAMAASGGIVCAVVPEDCLGAREVGLQDVVRERLSPLLLTVTIQQIGVDVVNFKEISINENSFLAVWYATRGPPFLLRASLEQSGLEFMYVVNPQCDHPRREESPGVLVSDALSSLYVGGHHRAAVGRLAVLRALVRDTMSSAAVFGCQRGAGNHI